MVVEEESNIIEGSLCFEYLPNTSDSFFLKIHNNL